MYADNNLDKVLLFLQGEEMMKETLSVDESRPQHAMNEQFKSFSSVSIIVLQNASIFRGIRGRERMSSQSRK